MTSDNTVSAVVPSPDPDRQSQRRNKDKYKGLPISSKTKGDVSSAEGKHLQKQDRKEESADPARDDEDYTNDKGEKTRFHTGSNREPEPLVPHPPIEPQVDQRG